MFLVAAGVGAVGFVLSLRLRERPLRATASTSQGLEDALAAPVSAALGQLDRQLAVLVSNEARRAFHEHVAVRAGVDLSPGAIWALARFDSYGIDGTRAMAREQGIEEERIAAVQRELRDGGLVAERDGSARLTTDGVAIAEQVISARHDELCGLLADPDTERLPEVQQLLSSSFASNWRASDHDGDRAA